MKKNLVALAHLEHSIHLLRGQKVILNRDLAQLYGVSTGNLNKAVIRDADRFPSDFMFRLKPAEWEVLTFQLGISKSRGGRRTLPYAFTEQGVAMLSSVLNSERFAEHDKRVGQHDQEITAIIDAIRQLMAPAKKSTREIGFHVGETPPRYGTRKRR